MDRPLLLLDVDGPLNPFRAGRAPLPRGYRPHTIHGLRVLLDPAHGPALTALPFDLVWATTWEHDANTEIAPRVGLPALPVITWPVGADTAPGLCFKTPTVAAYTAGRPFAWVDDEVTDTDRAWLAARRDAPFLLHRVSARRGLRPTDLATLATWAATHAPVAAPIGD